MAQKYEKQNSKVFAISGAGAGTHDGDITFLGTAVATTAGKCYMAYISGGNLTWTLADQDSTGKFEGLLAIALGSNSGTDGMLLRGMVTINGTFDTLAARVYLGDVGAVTNTAPSGGTDNVRVLGYSLDESQMYFNPDNTFIEIVDG